MRVESFRIMIKNIAFDFGGVLFDLDYEGAIRTFERLGLPDAAQRLDRYHQRGIFEDLESGRITTAEFIAALQPLCTRPITQEAVQTAWLGYVGGSIDERKLERLDDLRRRGYRTFLLSNTNPFVQSWAESSAFSASGRPLSSYLESKVGKYYVKGIRESGKEESHEYVFTAEKDEDFVLTYGLRGDQITY